MILTNYTSMKTITEICIFILNEQETNVQKFVDICIDTKLARINRIDNIYVKLAKSVFARSRMRKRAGSTACLITYVGLFQFKLSYETFRWSNACTTHFQKIFVFTEGKCTISAHYDEHCGQFFKSLSLSLLISPVLKLFPKFPFHSSKPFFMLLPKIL